MAALLAQVADGPSAVSAYMSTLLDAFPDRENGGSQPDVVREPRTMERETPAVLSEPLTARELDILRLIAAGHSNLAIAETLIIAVSTVKKHINNIFGKLAVESRTQAVMNARDLHLL